MSILDEATAQKNHYQSLQTLAKRGGLSPSEMLAIIDKRPWHSIGDDYKTGDEDEAMEELIKRVDQKPEVKP